MPYEGLDEQLITAVTGDAAPDVIRLDLTWVPQMAKLGALECLNDYAGFDDISAGIMPGSMSTTLYKGRITAFPSMPTPPLPYITMQCFRSMALTHRLRRWMR